MTHPRAAEYLFSIEGVTHSPFGIRPDNLEYIREQLLQQRIP